MIFCSVTQRFVDYAERKTSEEGVAVLRKGGRSGHLTLITERDGSDWIKYLPLSLCVMYGSARSVL